MEEFNRRLPLETSAREQKNLGETLVMWSLNRRKGRNRIVEFIEKDLNVSITSHQIQCEKEDRLYQETDENGTVLEWRTDMVWYVQLDDRTVEYLVEVKTGEYADYRNTQKETMQYLARHNHNPITVRIYLDKLPSQYDIAIRKMGLYE